MLETWDYFISIIKKGKYIFFILCQIYNINLREKDIYRFILPFHDFSWFVFCGCLVNNSGNESYIIFSIFLPDNLWLQCFSIHIVEGFLFHISLENSLVYSLGICTFLWSISCQLLHDDIYGYPPTMKIKV